MKTDTQNIFDRLTAAADGAFFSQALTRQHILDLIETTEGGVCLDYQTSKGFRATPFRLCNADGDVLLSGELDMTTEEDGFASEFTEALFGEFRDDLASVTEYKSLVGGIQA